MQTRKASPETNIFMLNILYVLTKSNTLLTLPFTGSETYAVRSINNNLKIHNPFCACCVLTVPVFWSRTVISTNVFYKLYVHLWWVHTHWYTQPSTGRIFEWWSRRMRAVVLIRSSQPKAYRGLKSNIQ